MQLDCFLEFRHHIDYEQFTVPVHRHRWHLRITMGADHNDSPGSRAGLLTSIKAALHRFNGRILNDIFPFTMVSPTHENIARCLFNIVDDTAKTVGGHVNTLSIWEDLELIIDMEGPSPVFSRPPDNHLPLLGSGAG